MVLHACAPTAYFACVLYLGLEEWALGVGFAWGPSLDACAAKGYGDDAYGDVEAVLQIFYEIVAHGRYLWQALGAGFCPWRLVLALRYVDADVGILWLLQLLDAEVGSLGWGYERFVAHHGVLHV